MRRLTLWMFAVGCARSPVGVDLYTPCARAVESASANDQVGSTTLADAAAAAAGEHDVSPTIDAWSIDGAPPALALRYAVDASAPAFTRHTATGADPTCGPATVFHAELSATIGLDGASVGCDDLPAVVEVFADVDGAAHTLHARCDAANLTAPYAAAWLDRVASEQGGALVNPRFVIDLFGQDGGGTVEIAVAYDGVDDRASASSASAFFGAWGDAALPNGGLWVGP